MPQVLRASAVLALKTLVTALVIALPLLGVWLASSLAAYANGPLWSSVAAGALLFPGLPLGWALWAAYRERRLRARRAELARANRVLTFWDRLILRTLAINLLALTALLFWFPGQAFTALSTRGDWFLDRVDATWKPHTRALLFSIADRMKWLYDLTHDNPFAPEDSPPPPPPPPSAAPDTRQQRPSPVPPPPASSSSARPAEQDTPPPVPAAPSAPFWPMPREPHPGVTSLPDAALTSVQALGSHLKAVESNPVLLVKALQDWVALNVAYDVPARGWSSWTRCAPRSRSTTASMRAFATLLRPRSLPTLAPRAAKPSSAAPPPRRTASSRP